MPTRINDSIRLEVAGENALMLYFSLNKSLVSEQQTSTITSSISPIISNEVHQAVQLIRQHFTIEIIDLIPSYASILVVFNLLEIDHHHLRNKLKSVLKQCGSASSKQGRLVELPAYYAIESGMDLVRIAKHAKLTVKQVITLHQAQEYRVYAIGFAPGFAYLGEVDERIAMPRLTTPRLKVPKGAIAIADRQTAVYPAESPGGWNIVGLCPIDMFNPQADPTMPIEVGDRLKFVAITKLQFIELGGKLPNQVSSNGKE
ncbi:allophanate hydrolase [Colwellia sp. 75C3]|uniref:5-oxoprolinase subunit PxpB n=1 Tax=Colwellia sp. 75C3 TaxID=888425 RepID=UPI000C34C202|nr:5-oxoprolinase subunit PxpB [Colwellia sp. 75C3]PKG82191.1 allophanate hydrolase [Colwellia sp. 75C3]